MHGVRVILLKTLTRSVFGIVGKVIYPGVWKMDARVSPIVEYVTRCHLRSLPKVI